MKNRFTFLIAFCLMAMNSFSQIEDFITNIITPTSAILDGNIMYISESGTGNRISKVDISMPNPTPQVLVQINSPQGTAIRGNELYITNYNSSSSIHKIDVTQPNPSLEVVVGGVFGAAALAFNGDELYIAQFDDGHISKINVTDATPTLELVATGVYGAYGLALKGNELFISELLNKRITKIDITQTPASPTVVVSGLDSPSGITVNGNFIYIAELNSGTIKKANINETNPTPEVVVSGLSGPRLCAFDGIDLYITESDGNKISRLEIGQPDFAPLGNICSNAVPTDLGGASPTGGTYSGQGVTDDGNGETFTFDPVAAGGVGSYTITYTAINGLTATSTLEIVAPPTATFTAPSPVIVDAGVQTGLGGGTPTGGIYSGTGVTDDGNGMTYSFDPMAAGVGTHTITYSYTDGNGCGDMASGEITVEACVAPVINGVDPPAVMTCFAQTTTFTVDGELNGAGQWTWYAQSVGGAPTILGSGTSVSAFPYIDTVIVFVRAEGGCLSEPSDSIAVTVISVDVAPPTIPTTFCDTTINIDLGSAASADLADFVNVAVIDNCDDASQISVSTAPMSVTSDQIGTMVTGTLTATDTEGNSAECNFTIVVMGAPENDECADAADINPLFTGAQNDPQTSALWDNTNATSVNDPMDGTGCFYQGDGLQHTIWYSFTSTEGNTYGIRTVQCDATNYITSGDTQMAIYTGDDCGNLTPVACGEDENPGAGVLNAYVELPTDKGVTYYIIVDGYDTNVGEFCLEVTNLAPNAATNIKETDIQIFPNPTTGKIQMKNVEPDQVQVFDGMGRLLFSEKQPGNSLDISEMPAGVYFLKITEGKEVYSARVVKE